MRKATDYRPAILEAAGRLFGRKRFDEVRMEDVAAEAGVAKGTVYRFYRAKEDLHSDLCMRALEALSDELRRIADEQASPRMRLERMLATATRHFRGHHGIFEVIQREWISSDERRRKRVREGRECSRRLYARVYQDGVDTGEFRQINSIVAADMLMGMARSVLHFGDPRRTPQQVAEMVLDVFFHGVMNGAGIGVKKERSGQSEAVLTHADGVESGLANARYKDAML